MKFGRLPHDPIRLAQAPALHVYTAQEPPPGKVDRSGINFDPILGQNNIYPDCTAVGVFNSAIMSSWALGGFAPFIDESQALRFYAAATGNPAATDDELAASQGAAILDVLDYQIKHGVSVGQQVPLVANYGVITTGKYGIARSIALLGGALVGIRVYERDEDELESPAALDANDGKPIGAEVGRHCCNLWDYPVGLQDTDIVHCVLWGQLKPVTWRWVTARTDEAHGLVWRQLAAPGVDVAALRAAVEGFVA